MDRNIYYYQYYTPYGAVSLIPEANGRYKVMFCDDNLGSYHSPEAAAGDVSGGLTSPRQMGSILANSIYPMTSASGKKGFL